MNRRVSSLFVLSFSVLTAFWPGVAAAQKPEEKWNFASAAIVPGEKAGELERLAAREVQRCLYRISGTLLPLADAGIATVASQKPLIALGTPETSSLVASAVRLRQVDAGKESLGEQGFVVKRFSQEGRPLVVIAGTTPYCWRAPLAGVLFLPSV